MTNQQKFSRLRKILDDASVYGRSIGKLNFDMQCCAPEEGMEQAGEDIAVLSKQLFRLTHSTRPTRGWSQSLPPTTRVSAPCSRRSSSTKTTHGRRERIFPQSSITK